MPFECGLSAGEVIDNEKLRAIFKCSSQAGMRLSKKTQSLVLVANHVISIFHDRWIGDIFHYTGMGSEGDQRFAFRQNKTLAESDTNGVQVHLFEVNQEQHYTYQGIVTLAAQPYAESQPDAKGAMRTVFVFPLNLVASQPVPLRRAEFEATQDRRTKQTARLNPGEIERRALAARPNAGERTVLSKERERDPNVASYAKLRAAGRCQLCGEPAPFMNKRGDPYLETHHIVWLARGGEDSVQNTVALCPNGHWRIHVLASDKDVEKLVNANPIESRGSDSTQIQLIHPGSCGYFGRSSVIDLESLRNAFRFNGGLPTATTTPS